MIEERRWPWVAGQNWEDVLFIHTPVSYRSLRPFVPQPFKLDTYDGTSWVSIVLFQATGSRLRLMPSAFSYPPFYQMNIRTYVTFESEPGVYFFSINTNSHFVNRGGALVSLPFQHAHLDMQKMQDTFYFQAQRQVKDSQDLALHVAYQPHTSSFQPKQDTLPFFLTERYCIWMLNGNRIMKAPILHSHWDLHHANLKIQTSKGLPFSFSDESFAHYTAFKHTVIHPFETFGKVSK